MKFKFLVPVAGLVAAIANQYASAAIENTEPSSTPVAAGLTDAPTTLALTHGGEHLVRAGDDNYSFILKRAASGEMMAWHQSHASHASHASHSSHSSHSSHRSGF